MTNAYKDLYQMTTLPDTRTYAIVIGFPTTDVSLSEEIQLNNISDFISSVGGNLGLFIGFSFLSKLLELAEWYRKIPIKNLFH